MKCVLAIDQGTTGSTSMVIAQDGRVLGRGYREFTQHFPSPGWVEHDAHEILECTFATAREALDEAKSKHGAVPAALGITNQRETVVLWDRATGRAEHRAIVWQDRRTAARCTALAPQAPMIQQRTGLVTDPYFSATKIEWLLQQPGALAKAERGELAVGTIDSWLIWHLTGGAVHATDHTNASRTMLYDINENAWSNELCALFGVPRALLPTVLPSTGAFGTTVASTIGVQIPIGGVAGDQQAALFGQGGWSAGGSKNTYGTGAFLLLNTGRQRPQPSPGLLTTIACDVDGKPVYALEGSIFIAGAAVQWLRDGLQIITSASEAEPMVRALASNDGVYFVPALTGQGAPDWEPNARGTIVGITRGTTRAHFVRAALEAMAYGTHDVLQAMQSAGNVPFDVLRVDGGATHNNWLMQFQADVLGVPVERPDMVETTALGAAGLAGISSGVWRDGNDFLASRQFTRFAPGAGRPAALVAHAEWRRAVRAALHWARDHE